MDPEEEARIAAAAEAEAEENRKRDEALAALSAEEEAARKEEEKRNNPDPKDKDAELARLQGLVDSLTERFKGIDPERARQDRDAVSAAERAARDAEKARAEAEGNWERLRELANEEAEREKAAIAETAAQAQERAEKAERQVQSLKVENAFASSKYLNTETVLSTAKARRLYGDHVEYKDGKIIVYDKAEGEARRTMLVDARGNPLSFEDGIKKVIEADPDKDTFIKATVVPGAGSQGNLGKPTEPQVGSTNKITDGLRKLRGL